MWRGASSRPAAVVERIRGVDFSAYSDRQLREALDDLRRRCQRGPADDVLPEVFALVNESVSRRLGAWRLFDPGFDKRGLRWYEELADRILSSGPYRDRLAFYTDPSFLESDAFARSIDEALRQMGLDSDEKSIVRSMVYVAEKRGVDHGSNIHLPAEFYEALAAKDDEDALEFRATDEQLLAGLLLYRGNIVEMTAGEGKTIAAAFPAVLHALSGRSVHIITANDYLAVRDADWLAPVYESLGLTVDAVLGYMSDEERRHFYQQQIVYSTLRELGFDYLRDNLKLPPDERVQGVLEVAIVDEADHALIDQARTPLIISGDPAGNRRALHRTRSAIQELMALQKEKVRAIEARLGELDDKSGEWYAVLGELLLADPDSKLLRRRLAADPQAYRRASAIIDSADLLDRDEKLAQELFYVVDPRFKSVTLTEAGQDSLEARLGPIFDASILERKLASIEADANALPEERARLTDRLTRRIHRQNNRMNQVYQLLRAYVLLKKDVDYVVTDGNVVLMDELTGRTLADNLYQHGLHAALEAKEGVTVHPECETLAQTSVQGFMKRYRHIGGMTGTALDSRGEFEREYGLRVVAIPPTEPSMRTDFGARAYRTRAEKLDAVLEQVKLCRRVGRPILVATLTVEQSDEISLLLGEHGIKHNLLNAVNDSGEAEIVENAGAFGAVTIATNMAGRGTDILLEPGLDRRILAGYVDLIGELLGNGKARVELTCATTEEAGLLWGALSACDRLEVSRNTQADRPYGSVLVARRKGTEAAGEGVRLEFGLGLYVVGTEMNPSSRVDRQLRGRSGRQGAFGASRFILSLEDQTLAFRGGSASLLSDGPRPDASLRTYFEGPRLERHLEAVQSTAEAEDEIGRSAVHEYSRVLESQTVSYYRARREVIESDSFHAVCRSFVNQWAIRLVERHFPELRLHRYSSQFDCLAEELWLDFGIDCYWLWGSSMVSLSDEIGDLLLDKLDYARKRLGQARLVHLEKLLFLQTSDELWKDHMAGLDGLMQSITLGQHSHKAAVAEFAIQGSKAYEQFKASVIDAFLQKLASFPVESPADDVAQQAGLMEEVSRILV